MMYLSHTHTLSLSRALQTHTPTIDMCVYVQVLLFIEIEEPVVFALIQYMIVKSNRDHTWFESKGE